LFGVPLDLITMDETVAMCVQLIERRHGAQHVVLNAGKVVLMEDEPGLRDIIAECEIINADGQSVVWAGRLLGWSVPERVTGIDLMDRLLLESEARGWSVYFLGATPEVLSACVTEVLRRYPDLRVSGSRDGYFDDSDAIAAEIARVAPHVLLLGMPSPRKELLLHEWRARLPETFAMGVGGSFDIWAGKSERAPVWMRTAGLEWAYRLVQEPSRMWKRYLVGNVRFAWLVLRELLSPRRA